MSKFKYTHCAEETCIATILLNSSLPVKNDSLRFWDWAKGSKSPLVLDETYYTAIKDSNAVFARKIDPIKSAKLIQLLDS